MVKQENGQKTFTSHHQGCLRVFIRILKQDNKPNLSWPHHVCLTSLFSRGPGTSGVFALAGRGAAGMDGLSVLASRGWCLFQTWQHWHRPSGFLAGSNGNIIRRAKWLTKSINQTVHSCQILMVLSQTCKGFPIKLVEVFMVLQNWWISWLCFYRKRPPPHRVIQQHHRLRKQSVIKRVLD